MFDQQAESLIQQSTQVASELKHQQVLVEHLVLTLLYEQQVQAELTSRAIDVDALRQAVLALIMPLPVIAANSEQQTLLSPQLSKTLHQALTRLQHGQYQAAYWYDILTAVVMDVKSAVAQVLMQHGVTVTLLTLIAKKFTQVELPEFYTDIATRELAMLVWESLSYQERSLPQLEQELAKLMQRALDTFSQDMDK